MIEEYEIRTYLKPGDIGYITYLHGILYAKEFGWDYTFEAYVAGPLSDFAKSNNPGDRIWIVEVSDKICGSIALMQLDTDHAQLRWFLLDPCLRGKGIGKKLITLLEAILKKTFWPNLGVGPGFRILEIPAYVCGSKPGPAYILDQNPFFEMASSRFCKRKGF